MEHGLFDRFFLELCVNRATRSQNAGIYSNVWLVVVEKTHTRFTLAFVSIGSLTLMTLHTWSLLLAEVSRRVPIGNGPTTGLWLLGCDGSRVCFGWEISTGMIRQGRRYRIRRLNGSPGELGESKTKGVLGVTSILPWLVARSFCPTAHSEWRITALS